ncbi:helix-turn-helix transcriptional regulator [uncultured Bosea sp.]|uniref:helix-turn-helix domain-containing protein n=1 Tax=uncultured Bosea sp. TaxID=211457 RepID=UPI00263B73A6|nr:helix-turn-helix transcriptional regulator [uncultured Bosea sp.]
MKIFAAGIEYDELIRAMRDRRMQLGLSQTDIDQLAGVPGGYYAKCESMLTNPSAKNARAIGRDSLPKLLTALGLRFAVIAETEFQAEKFKGRGLKVKLGGDNAELIQRLPPNRILSERGKKGGLKRWATMTPEQRQAFLDAGAAARRARRPVKAEPLPPPPAPEPEPLQALAPPRRVRPTQPPLTKRQAAKLRKKLVAERAAAKTNPAGLLQRG